MSDKNNDDKNSKYIYDRARKRLKTKGETRKEKASERKADQKLFSNQRARQTSKEEPDMDLGCWFFLILPFIGTILALVILIGFLMQG